MPGEVSQVSPKQQHQPRRGWGIRKKNERAKHSPEPETAEPHSPARVLRTRLGGLANEPLGRVRKDRQTRLSFAVQMPGRRDVHQRQLRAHAKAEAVRWPHGTARRGRGQRRGSSAEFRV